MKQLYFVRHAEPDHDWKDDRTRPLSPAGLADCGAVTRALHDIAVDRFVSSPYKRSYDTIRESAADHALDIVTDERLREREQGLLPNSWEMLERRWRDYDFCEGGGESLHMVQKRNMEAINELLGDGKGDTIVIGTHGTALCTILNDFDPNYGFSGFKRIIDFMPYIIRLDFEGVRCVGREEILIVKKPFVDRYLNSLIIRRLELPEIPEALRLVGNTFMEFEAPDYSQQGISKFMECLADKDFIAGLVFYGAFIHGLQAGVLATRTSGSHIAMFFVRREYQRQGIGRRLFESIRGFCQKEKLTVNSSPYAVPVYGRLGFAPTDTEQVSDGIRYTPMEYVMKSE